MCVWEDILCVLECICVYVRDCTYARDCVYVRDCVCSCGTQSVKAKCLRYYVCECKGPCEYRCVMSLWRETHVPVSK